MSYYGRRFDVCPYCKQKILIVTHTCPTCGRFLTQTAISDACRTNQIHLQTKDAPRITPEQLSPIEFEDLVERLYTAMGYSARRTQQTRDGGIDVIAIRDHPMGWDKLAIQCKRQENPVGRPELQNLLGVITADTSFSAGVMITTSTFSADARRFAELNGRIRLVDKNILAQQLHHNHVPLRK